MNRTTPDRVGTGRNAWTGCSYRLYSGTKGIMVTQSKRTIEIVKMRKMKMKVRIFCCNGKERENGECRRWREVKNGK